MTATEKRPAATWPLLLLALPAFVAIWSGWVGLGERTGFGVVQPFPGIPYLDGVTVNTAITLPIGVETYAAYALRVWLSGAANDRARRFARWSATISLVLGGAGQVAYHLMVVGRFDPVTIVVSCLPVAVLGMGVALAHLQNERVVRVQPTRPVTLTVRPGRSIAWSAPTRSMPDPMEAIESTARSIEAIRSLPAATRSTPIRSTAIVPDPIDPPIDRPTPDRPRADRPDMRSNDRSATGTTPRSGSPAPDRSDPDWVGRSTLAPGGGTRRSLDELLADLDAALGPAEAIPSANALRRHYGIGAPRDRELRDAITNVRRRRAAGGVEGDIGS